MGRLLLSLSFLSLVIVGLGTLFLSQDPLFWTASADINYQVIRLTLAIVLLIQIITEPPRTLFFRVLSGSIALGVGTWTVMATYSYSMMLLDTLSLLSAAFAIGVSALEIEHTSDEYLPNDDTVSSNRLSHA